MTGEQGRPPGAGRAAAAELVGRLAALADDGMRRAALLARLAELPPGEAAALLDGLLALAAARE
ncbi:MAG TPA: hypothetical protein VNM66_00115, partial [Thermodesulfobacteriota bacterium]|nr:hypothetical protein [Thermodesulfobacteriota bacterium]